MYSYIRGITGKYPAIFEYPENRSLGIDVTWQPVRGDLIVHPWTITLPWA